MQWQPTAADLHTGPLPNTDSSRPCPRGEVVSLSSRNELPADHQHVLRRWDRFIDYWGLKIGMVHWSNLPAVPNYNGIYAIDKTALLVVLELGVTNADVIKKKPAEAFLHAKNVKNCYTTAQYRTHHPRNHAGAAPATPSEPSAIKI